MNCRQTRKLCEELIDKGISLQERPELERHLEQCAECRAWCDRERQIVRNLGQQGSIAPASDFAQQVLDRLPDMPLRALDQVVELLAQAWEEPRFREMVRADPRRTLREQGVDLPPGVRVTVVAPEKATLPTRDSLPLPLPGPREGAHTLQEMRHRLRHSAAAILIDPALALETVEHEGLARTGRFDPTGSRLHAAWESFASRLARPLSPRTLAPALALAASLLLVAGLIYSLQGEGLSSTPGAATGAGSWAIGGVALAALILFAMLAWHNRK